MGVPSLASKRPAATSLPTFSLPPPEIPRVVPDGLASSGSHSTSSQSSPPGGASLYYSNHMTGSWPTPGGTQLSAYTYASSNSGTASSGPLAQSSYARAPPSYGTSSPSLQHFAPRASSSAPNGESVSAPHSYQDQPAFSAGAGGSALGSPLSSQPQGGHQQSGLARPAASGQSTQGGQHTGQEGNSYRAPPTPTTYYPPTSASQQASFPPYPSPVTQASPVTSPATSSGPMPRGLASISAMAPPLQYSGGRGHHVPPPMASYASYGPIPGPVLSNMHHPGAPLTMVSGMALGGYGHHPGLPPHHPHNLYAHHPTHPTPSDRDRPFRCDKCSHAFNRNHDLKRHSRIHMDVKPYPCGDCDKRFSRKDALKRHRLVKGCGGRSPPEGTKAAGAKDRGDAVGGIREGSPRSTKTE